MFRKRTLKYSYTEHGFLDPPCILLAFYARRVATRDNMSGKGPMAKKQKGLGQCGAKRFKTTILRDNIKGVTKPAIRRLARSVLMHLLGIPLARVALIHNPTRKHAGGAASRGSRTAVTRRLAAPCTPFSAT